MLIETPRRSSPQASAYRVMENLVRSMASVARWIEIRRQRAQLAELEDHQLADLGLSPAQVRKECAKWPWQA
ncbi:MULTISPECIES: DUF1127 domain-containing protein [unclassified Mesorhizobium]|uniref:DUF1127 domain-containing protein n=1 Tax=unclassified Mesorhizobium TaxID=325217 RepID=UPI0003CEA2D7|nr:MULTISPECIES: DUF1127 domain-containing protein [unclassified Mesorhizobium]ESX41306.1 hypothetical protein X764_13135 [Mesorhizobium sp. LSHC440A00]WJI55568.1 DUF1127 domain-containing protein [Mesorhizobium sp. C432A]